MTGLPGALTLEGVSVRFKGLQALSEVNAAIPSGEISALIGPNGAGKSTLLNVMSGFAQPSKGRVLLGDTEITSEPVKARVFRGILRSFQTVRLLEGESVADNVLLGRERFNGASVLGQLRASRRFREDYRRDREMAADVCRALGILPHFNVSVSNLPFGIRRLVEVARVLAAEPSLLLLDEPAAGLDSSSRERLEDAILQLQAESAVSVVVVEHDIQLVRTLCSRAWVLDRGRIISEGRAGDVLDSDTVKAAYFG